MCGIGVRGRGGGGVGAGGSEQSPGVGGVGARGAGRADSGRIRGRSLRSAESGQSRRGWSRLSGRAGPARGGAGPALTVARLSSRDRSRAVGLWAERAVEKRPGGACVWRTAVQVRGAAKRALPGEAGADA